MADDAAADNDGGLGGDKKDTPAQKKQVKNEHILIAVGIVTLIVTLLYLRKSSANSANSSSGGSVAQSPYGVNSYGASAQDPYGYGGEINTLANDLQSMQSEIAGLTPPTASTQGAPGVTAPGGPVYGTWDATLPGGQQQSNTGLFNPVATGASLPDYTTLFYEPSPGNFVTVNPNAYGSLPSGTQLYDFSNPNPQPYGLQQWAPGGGSSGLRVPATG